MTVQIKTTRTIKVPGGEIRKVEHTKVRGRDEQPRWVLYDADGKYQWTERRLGNAKRRASREYQRPIEPDEVSVQQAAVGFRTELRVGGVLKGTFDNHRQASKAAMQYLESI